MRCWARACAAPDPTAAPAQGGSFRWGCLAHITLLLMSVFFSGECPEQLHCPGLEPLTPERCAHGNPLNGVRSPPNVHRGGPGLLPSTRLANTCRVLSSGQALCSDRRSSLRVHLRWRLRPCRTHCRHLHSRSKDQAESRRLRGLLRSRRPRPRRCLPGCRAPRVSPEVATFGVFGWCGW